MKQLTVVAASLVILSACGKQDAVPPAPTSSTTGGRPDKMPNGEPGVITLKHVLIAFKGTGIEKVTRSREEAEKLAYDIVSRAKSGEDFDKLMKDYSDDSPEGGTYTMVNDGLQPSENEYARSGPRGMVKAFGDVGFRISVGEVGVAEHHATDSPYGWHIIKRTK